MSDTLLLKLTNAGRLAMIDHVNSGFNLSLVSVKLGTGLYKTDPLAGDLVNPWAEFPVVNGFVDTEAHCLNFMITGQTNEEIKVSEIGLFDHNGVLFAVLSKEAGCFFQTERASFFSFSLAVAFDQKIDGQKIKLSFRPQDSILKALLILHIQYKDAHPQYKRFVENLFREHIQAADPHSQYTMKAEFQQHVAYYMDKLHRLTVLFSEFLDEYKTAGVAYITNSATIGMPANFKGNLTTNNHVMFITPEAGHEAWSLSRAAQTFSLNVFNRSGINRVGYAGLVNWLVMSSDLSEPIVGIDMPELVAAGVRSSTGALKVTKAESKGGDFNSCVFLMAPEGAHEAWTISRSAAEFNANIFNRSGTNRIGYSGPVNFAIFKPKDGRGDDPIRFPGLLMSGVSETGTFDIVAPNGKAWNFSDMKYAVIVTPEGEHEAWDITRSANKISVSVYGRSGQNRIGYNGKVSWAVFQKTA